MNEQLLNVLRECRADVKSGNREREQQAIARIMDLKKIYGPEVVYDAAEVIANEHKQTG